MAKISYKIPRFRPSLPGKAIVDVCKKSFSISPLANDDKQNRRFEEAFAHYIGVKHAVIVPSGRMGLYSILGNAGLKAQSRIILSAFNYWAVPHIVSFLNFMPQFADIKPAGYNLDAAQIGKHIDASAKAVIVTHLYGSPCDMDEIRAVADKHNLLVIEDCVQACGAEYKGKKAGSLGDAAYFSFGITKNLPLVNGGMVTTDNDALAQRIREEVRGYDLLNNKQILTRSIMALAMKIFTQPGIFPLTLFPLMRVSRFSGKDIVGAVFEEKERLFEKLPEDYFRVPPSDVLADLGFEQLRGLDGLNNGRIENALYLLGNLKKSDNVTLPGSPGNGIKNIFTNFPIRVKNRDLCAGELLKKGVDTSSGYMRAFGKDCPRAAEAERGILHIPVYPSLDKSRLSYISQAVNECLERICL